MSAGMAEVIAAHKEIENLVGYTWGCRCGWRAGLNDDHPVHMAEELAKAGYGLLPDVAPEYGAQMMTHGGLSGMPFGHGPVRNPNWWNKSTHMRLVGPWQELEPPPDPLAAALADPEGHALVKAIRDRKAGA